MKEKRRVLTIDTTLRNKECKILMYVRTWLLFVSDSADSWNAAQQHGTFPHSAYRQPGVDAVTVAGSSTSHMDDKIPYCLYVMAVYLKSRRL